MDPMDPIVPMDPMFCGPFINLYICCPLLAMTSGFICGPCGSYGEDHMCPNPGIPPAAAAAAAPVLLPMLGRFGDMFIFMFIFMLGENCGIIMG